MVKPIVDYYRPPNPRKKGNTMSNLTKDADALNDKMDAIFIANAAHQLQSACHGAAQAAGWWPEGATENPLMFSNKLCLIHSEVSESMEGDRKGLMDDKLPHREMREVELADAVIRIFDLAGAYGFDLGGAIVEKMAFNAIRPDHKKEAREAEGGKTY